ncbi:hypothetical protein IAE51_00020 [Lactococcus sp. S64]|uniref:pectate lyase-like adhesive domain-containing protein n=1 Tax=Lactococcus sp. S64 TaxID=2767459 RepID=UPI0019032FCB|nr:pectate lyase-like adhesive domain-containing protein [Lactococcus sp. S64]MBK0082311.1 hypothetical protein [Lactococcus sp. S64]
MRKALYVGICGITLAVVGGVVGQANASVLNDSPKVDQAAGQEVTVSTFSELSTALKDTGVGSIKIGGDITFTGSILDIPQRAITIDGQGHSLKLQYFLMTGALGAAGGTLTIKNATITNLDALGNPVAAFFVTPSENWAVNVAGGVDYTGERFLEVQNSVVTFSGKNMVHTSAENAWVRSINFASSSEYTSTAATEGEFAAFYFNGDLVGGKAVGKVKVDTQAKVNITVSPNNDSEFYYPAFYDKVDRVDVNEGATLNITAAGHALQFIPRGDYDEVPSVNVEKGGTLHLVGHGTANYSTINFQQPNSQLNAKEGSTLYIEGKGNKVIETAKNSIINITNADYDLRNSTAGSPIFECQNTFLNFSGVTMSVWDKTGGDYSGLPMFAWNTLKLSTIIQNGDSFNTTSTDDAAQQYFHSILFGRISGIVTKP